jgi:hypothetical protein
MSVNVMSTSLFPVPHTIRLYSGVIPVEQVAQAYSTKRAKLAQLENMENGRAVELVKNYGAAYRNRTDT